MWPTRIEPFQVQYFNPISDLDAQLMKAKTETKIYRDEVEKIRNSQKTCYEKTRLFQKKNEKLEEQVKTCEKSIES